MLHCTIHGEAMSDTNGWRDGMRDALRLVKAGELRSATRAIQAAISGRNRASTAHGAHETTARVVGLASLPSPDVEPQDSTPDPAADAAAVDALAGAAADVARRRTPSDEFEVLVDRAPALDRWLPSPRLPSGRRAPAIRLRPTPAPHSRTPALQYRLFASDDSTGPRPLLVMLHGCSQDSDDFARGTRAAAQANALGWHVLFPEQPARANGARCWNWFRPQDQGAESGEPRALLDVIDTVAATHAIDAARVYVAGLSAGAAMAVILAARHPERIAAVAAHSGLPFAAAQDVPGAFTAMRTRGAATPLPAGPFVPLLALHGDADRTVAPANSDELVAQWRAALPTPVEHRVEQQRIEGRESRRDSWSTPDGHVLIESWRIAGATHAWSGGDATGSYTEPGGPDATAIMLRFFATHARDG